MNEEDYQELLSRANSLIEERLASVPPVALPSNIPIRGRTASYAAIPVEKSSEYDFKMYTADLLVDSSRVRVVPYGLSGLSTEYFMVPNIGGRSIFNENPPTLSRRSGGAAVYLETVLEVYDTGDKYVTGDGGGGSEIGDPIFRGRLREANIVDRSLGSPYPIKKAVISYTWPDNDSWNVDESEAKVYSLIGVYNAAGEVFNQTSGLYHYPYRTFIQGRRIIPPQGPAAVLAPIKYNISFED